MPFQPRWSAAAAAAALLIGVVGAAPAEAQTPAPRIRREAPRALRVPRGRIELRIPHMTLRSVPPIRLDRGAFRLRTPDRGALRLRALDRAFDRMDRVRDRQFALQERAGRRQLETRERALSRVRDRMGPQLRVRPFGVRRHLRTI